MTSENRTLVDNAIESIRHRIAEGLETGDRLPPERILVTELGVSRTVLREALSSLEALGLVEVRGTRGRFVTPGGSSERSKAIVSRWFHENAREILEMDEIRAVLEAHAIQAMNQWEAVDAARRAAVILRNQREAVAAFDPVEAARLDAEFHLVLVAYSKNNALRELLEELILAARRETLAVYSLPDVSGRSLAQHQQIVEALAKSDVDQVAELVRLHLIDAAQRYSTSSIDLDSAPATTPGRRDPRRTATRPLQRARPSAQPADEPADGPHQSPTEPSR